jgi:conjugal transfer/entry exclusion protein
MAKHGITITDQLFGTVASDITTLRQIVNTGQALSYTLSNMDGTFRLRFPGYSPSTNYGQSYQTWSQTSLNQIAENQAEQLMKLRQLMMADMQSKSAYQSAMVQADATKQANSDQFFGQTQVTSDGVTF